MYQCASPAIAKSTGPDFQQFTAYSSFSGRRFIEPQAALQQVRSYVDPLAWIKGV